MSAGRSTTPSIPPCFRLRMRSESESVYASEKAVWEACMIRLGLLRRADTAKATGSKA